MSITNCSSTFSTARTARDEQINSLRVVRGRGRLAIGAQDAQSSVPGDRTMHGLSHGSSSPR
eukprot:15551377-Heterocapsa_arctica.AAC.1